MFESFSSTKGTDSLAFDEPLPIEDIEPALSYSFESLTDWRPREPAGLFFDALSFLGDFSTTILSISTGGSASPPLTDLRLDLRLDLSLSRAPALPSDLPLAPLPALLPARLAGLFVAANSLTEFSRCTSSAKDLLALEREVLSPRMKSSSRCLSSAFCIAPKCCESS